MGGGGDTRLGRASSLTSQSLTSQSLAASDQTGLTPSPDSIGTRLGLDAGRAGRGWSGTGWVWSSLAGSGRDGPDGAGRDGRVCTASYACTAVACHCGSVRGGLLAWP